MPRDMAKARDRLTGRLAGLVDLYRGWRKYNRDRADLAVMSDIELQDIGVPTFSAWGVSTLVILPRADGMKGARTCVRITGSIFATIVA
jgi:uncharacterized protein YjiS (DUF1127 family)